jgi:hypothetical protein
MAVYLVLEGVGVARNHGIAARGNSAKQRPQAFSHCGSRVRKLIVYERTSPGYEA